MSFNTTLHGLRGLAALSVLLFHWKANYPALAVHTQAVPLAGTTWDLFYWISGGGIHWFFVLSGYQISASLWHKPLNGPTLHHFWLRRFLRIYPTVWLHLTILVVVTYLILGSFSFLQWGQLVGNAALWFEPLPWGVRPYNGVMWTLTVELLFYATLPLILLGYRRKGIWFVLLMGLTISVAYRAAMLGLHDDQSTTTLRTYPGLLFLFVAGFSINHFAPKPDKVLRYALLGAGVVLLLWWRYPIQYAEHGPWLTIAWDLVMGMLIAWVVSLVIQPLHGLGWLSARPLLWLGNLSLGIYLWHLPVLRWLPRVMPGAWNTPQDSALALTICLAATFFMATLGYLLIEKPLRNVAKSPAKPPALKHTFSF